LKVRNRSQVRELKKLKLEAFKAEGDRKKELLSAAALLPPQVHFSLIYLIF